MKKINSVLFALTVTLGLAITGAHAQAKDADQPKDAIVWADEPAALLAPAPAAPPAPVDTGQGGQMNPYESVPSWPNTLPPCFDINLPCLNSCRAQFTINASALYQDAMVTWNVFHQSFLATCQLLDAQVAACIAAGGDPVACEAAVAHERAEAAAFWGHVQARLAAAVNRQLGKLNTFYLTCINQCCS